MGNQRTGNTALFLIEKCLLKVRNVDVVKKYPIWSNVMDEYHELKISYYLDQIVRLLYSIEYAISRVKIKNSLNLSIEDAQAAIDYGLSEKVLKKDPDGKVSVLKDFHIREEKFYAAVQKGLERFWIEDGYKQTEFHIETTAGKKTKIAGRWTRPDLTLVSHRKFSWTIGHEFDVVTFEIKRPDSCDVLAVFEALSHATAATRTYVVFPVEENEWLANAPEQAARVKDECSRHGVGLILIENVYHDPKPKLLIRANKRDVDHERCSDFLEKVMSNSVKSKISEWK